MEAEAEIKKGDASIKAIWVNSVDADLLDAAGLLGLPISRASKKILRHSSSEIIYRLLAGGEEPPQPPLSLIEGATRRISRN